MGTVFENAFAQWAEEMKSLHNDITKKKLENEKKPDCEDCGCPEEVHSEDWAALMPCAGCGSTGDCHGYRPKKNKRLEAVARQLHQRKIDPITLAPIYTMPEAWLDELDAIAASHGFPPVRNCVEYTVEKYGDLTPEEAFQQDWLDYTSDDGD